jgi:hypothetical protein
VRRAALAILLCSPCQASRVGAWRETFSPHFEVSHETPLLPNGFTMDLERMHNRLRVELSLFAPWMANERIKLYYYASRKSYLAGEFKPPEWSNGLSEFRTKSVVTHEQESPKKLQSVIAHETTHLLLKSYWGEQGKEPPPWLNEGLAMVEEAPDPESAERSDWHAALYTLTPTTIIPLEKFLPVGVKDLRSKEVITLWYIESYSLVFYLLRKHTKLQFFTFCRSLRDGEPVEKALWKAYRIKDVGALEAEWKRWLKLPEVQQSFASINTRPREEPAPKGSRKKSGGLKEVSFDSFSFHNFRPQ